MIVKSYQKLLQSIKITVEITHTYKITFATLLIIARRGQKRTQKRPFPTSKAMVGIGSHGPILPLPQLEGKAGKSDGVTKGSNHSSHLATQFLALDSAF